VGSWLVPVLVVSAICVVAVVVWQFMSSRRDLGTSADSTIFDRLHTAAMAAPPLRGGLNADGARKAAKHLRALLGTPAVALAEDGTVLAWDGTGSRHAATAGHHSREVLSTGRTQVLGPEQIACQMVNCQIRYGVVAPLAVEGRVVGTLAAYGPEASAALVRATNEIARWVSGQLELAELDRSRTRLIEAEVRALRAQISPHFIYNSLTAIASFVRTDPERARELLLEFADFTRYSFRRHGDFTTLAEELRSVERYLLLERARFGDRLGVVLQIAPEVLPVAIPFLCLQPLVENAVRHGIENKEGPGKITILAEDSGAEAHISVEDDGVGMDPERLRRAFAGEVADDSAGGHGIGLSNVDERLRQVYGDEYGLVVETAIGAGTKVSMRVPKYRAGVSAS
jgi:two-component system, LytTR family, sensor kinase